MRGALFNPLGKACPRHHPLNFSTGCAPGVFDLKGAATIRAPFPHLTVPRPSGPRLRPPLYVAPSLGLLPGTGAPKGGKGRGQWKPEFPPPTPRVPKILTAHLIMRRNSHPKVPNFPPPLQVAVSEFVENPGNTPIPTPKPPTPPDGRMGYRIPLSGGISDAAPPPK